MAVTLTNHTDSIEIVINTNLKHFINKGSFDVTILTGSDGVNTLDYVWIMFTKRQGQIKDNIQIDWRDVTPSVASAEALRDVIDGWNSPPVAITSSALPDGAATEAKQDVGNTSLSSLDTKTGEVDPAPTSNTILGRLKDIWDRLLDGSQKSQIVDAGGLPAEIDNSTHSIQIVDYAHHEIHSGSTFCVHLKDLTFSKNGEMGVLFKTPAGAKWFHLVYQVDVACKSSFDILEGPTVDTGNYPTTFYAPRNRNSLNVSTAISVRAVPAANQVGLILDGNTTPIAADGTVLHTEVLGGKKGKSASEGHSHDDEYILKADTVYYFRIKGDNTGEDNLQLSIELIWYEHTDKN